MIYLFAALGLIALHLGIILLSVLLLVNLQIMRIVEALRTFLVTAAESLRHQLLLASLERLSLVFSVSLVILLLQLISALELLALCHDWDTRVDLHWLQSMIEC